MTVPAHPDAVACWTQAGTSARLDCAGLSAVVQLVEPWGGLHELVYDGASLGGSLLGVGAEVADLPGNLRRDGWTPTDAYVRGCDLVALYGETAERPFSLQIYWRVQPALDDGGLVIDAIVSVQTRAWEAFPEVRISSALPSGQSPGSRSDRAREFAAILRPGGARWSYVETSATGDFSPDAAAEPGAEGMLRTSWRFGRQFMERGVIRRLRLRAALVPREGDVATARRLHEELAAEQPPLTA